MDALSQALSLKTTIDEAFAARGLVPVAMNRADVDGIAIIRKRRGRRTGVSY